MGKGPVCIGIEASASSAFVQVNDLCVVGRTARKI